MPQFRITLVLTLTALCGVVSSGMPGSPGGSGGMGGAGGGSFGGFGGAGGMPGSPGAPGGSSSSLADYEFGFSLLDFLPVFDTEDENTLGPVGPPKRFKIKVPKICEDVEGVEKFVKMTSLTKKKEWLVFVLKLARDGNKPCAQELAKELLLKDKN